MTKGRQGHDFSPKLIKNIRERSAFICNNPLCRQLTVKASFDNDTDSDILGEAAHIYPAAKNWARYDDTILSSFIKSQKNAIWLCRVCSKLIDRNPKKYTADVLFQWKSDLEFYVQNLTTQDSRLRQLRLTLSASLTAMRILSALPGPGPSRFDQTFFLGNNIPLTRVLIETRQILFENDFIKESHAFDKIVSELTGIYRKIEQVPADTHLNISSWKNKIIKLLMIDILNYPKESFKEYVKSENALIEEALVHINSRGHKIEALS